MAKYRSASSPVGQQRRALVDAAKDKPCVDCGKVLPPRFMCLIHNPERGTQLFRIADRARRVSLSALEAEITKCDPVCAGCHAKRMRKVRVRVGIDENGWYRRDT
jgi:hypothetical protein